MRFRLPLFVTLILAFVASPAAGQNARYRRSVKPASHTIPSFQPAHEKLQQNFGAAIEETVEAQAAPVAEPEEPAPVPVSADAAPEPEPQASDALDAKSLASVQPAGFSQSLARSAANSGCRDCGSVASPCAGCAECDGACTDCGDGACSGCEVTSVLPRFWGRAEYLLWWTQGVDNPVLATTSSGTPNQATAGVLGAPNTSALFGNDPLHRDARSGGRYTLGMWFDDWNQVGIEGSFLGLIDDEEAFAAASPNIAVLARPFLNLQTGAEDARLIVFPNVSSGGLNIRSTTELQAYEVNLRRGLSQYGICSVETLLGYRGANLDEGIAFRESTLGLSGPAQGATIVMNESFRTANQFHGGQLGLSLSSQRSAKVSLELIAKVAMGNTRERVDVAGTTTTTTGGTTTTTQAGLLTQGTNIRSLEQNEFSTISEFGISLRRHLPFDITLSAGYNFLYWSDVLRAGNLIDRGINTTQIPPGTLNGAARPALPLDSQSFWAQGLHFGLEYLF